MALDFSHTLEAGDLSAFASTQGDVSAHADAAMTGSFGLRVISTGSGTTDFVTADITDESSHDVNFRYKLDPNSLTMSSGDEFFTMIARNSTNQSLHFTTLEYDGANYRMRGGCTNDSGVNIFTPFYTLSDAPQTIELEIRAASGASGADGTITVYINDSAQASPVTNLQLFTRGKNVDVDLGFCTGVDSGTSGTIYFDDFAGDMTGTHIGLVGNAPVVSGPALIYTAVGYSEPIGTEYTISDADNDLDTLRYQCTEALGDITVTLSGSATISAGTNGTHDLTVSGTNAELLATHATAIYVPTTEGTESALTITATDDLAANDSETFSLDITLKVIQADTQSDLNATLATATVENATAETITPTLKVYDAGNRMGSDTTNFIFTAVVLSSMNENIRRRRRRRM